MQAESIPVTILDRIAGHVQAMPGDTALVCDGVVLDWASLDRRAGTVAFRLAGMGIGKGANVAVIGQNCADYVIIMLGILRTGACFVPLPTQAAPAVIERMISDCEAKAIFVGRGTGEALRSAEANFPAIPILPFDPLAEGPAGTLPTVDVQPEDDFNIIYSSGTTGAPKGIVHSHRMRGVQIDRMSRFGLGPGCVSLVSTPAYSNTTLAALLGALGLGATTVLMRRFDAAEFLRLAEAHRVTHAMLVPVQLQRILAHPAFDRFDLSAFQWKLCTSAPLAGRLKREAVERWPGKMLEMYGVTEGGPNCSLMVHDFPDKLHTVGRPTPGCEIRIVSEGQEAPPGTPGEVVGRSSGMMTGYYKQPNLTAQVHWTDPSGATFIRSGDIGYFDEDGFLVLLDRTKDVIISGGFNIYAADLEHVLGEHPAVAEVAVVAAPSDEWGETPVAFVVLDVGARADGEALRDFANQQLGKMQRIAHVEVVDALPRSEIGKVLKRELRQRVSPSGSASAPLEVPAG